MVVYLLWKCYENSDIDSFNDVSTDCSLSEHLSSVSCVDIDESELPQSETDVWLVYKWSIQASEGVAPASSHFPQT